MSRQHITWKLLFVLALVSGALVGAILPQEPSKATSYTYIVSSHPGGSSSLSCGWHDTCVTGSVQSGWALDWQGSASIYWKSYSNNNSGNGSAGTGRIAVVTNGNCDHRTYVDAHDIYGTYRAEILYLHTTSNYAGYWFSIGSGYYPQWTSYYLGTTIQETNCAYSTGLHVHQQATGGSWTKLNYPDVATCDIDDPRPSHRVDCGTYAVDTYAMLSTSWVTN